MALFVVPSITFAATTTPAVIGNLILNPQMASSTGSLPDHWGQGGFSATTTYTYPVAGPLSDDKAAQVNVTGISGGAAEWVFDIVPVTPNTTYSFSDWYKSDKESYLVVEWLNGNTTLKYEAVATLNPTNGAWVHTPPEVFTVPANANGLTVFHQLQDVGTLTTSNYALVQYVPSAQEALPQGIVSFSFDDAWTSQYDNAWPILKAANIPATFYVYTSPVKAASYDIFADIHESIQTVTTSNGTTWSDIFPDPTNSLYRFADTYQGAGTSTIQVTYTPNVGTTTSTSTILAASPSGSTRSSYVFALPALASSTPITISHTSADAFTATAPVLNEYGSGYMSFSQVLDLQTAGNEIGAHSVDHCNLFQLDKNPNSATTATGQCVPALASSTTASIEINNSKTDLQAVGISPDTFAYPYGTYDANVKSLVSSDGLHAARSVDIGYNTNQSDLFALKGQSVVASTTLADVESWVNYAKTNKVWLILIFHQVDNPAALASNGEDGGTTPTLLQDIVNYVNAQNILTQTVHQALSSITGATTTPPVPVLTTINVSPLTATLNIAGTQQLIGATLDQNSNPISASLIWTSSNPSVATVGSTTGLVTAVAAGTANIAAASGLITSTAPAVITVTSATSTDTTAPVIVLNGAQTISLNVGDTFTDPGATATDSVDATTTVIVGGDVVNTAVANTYHITYNAVDSAGNHATQLVRTVAVNSTSVAGRSGGGGVSYPFPSKTGDINHDGNVDIFDFNSLMINWGVTGVGVAGDLNNDGTVNLLDFNLLMINWGL